MLIEQLFSCPILSHDCNHDLDFLTEKCYLAKKYDEGRELSNKGGWQSNEIYEHDDWFPDLKYDLKLLAIEFAKTIGFDINTNLKLQNMWININNYKDYNTSHTHPNVFLSGVFYVKVPSEDGKIVFRHPALASMDRDWANVPVASQNRTNCGSYYFLPVENRVFMFPSWLEHEVTPHFLHEDRVSISFNFSVV